MAEVDEWEPFFQRVKSRPAAFYQKCTEKLTAQDIYEPGDLAELDTETFAAQLERCNATAGEVSFLRQAIALAKADAKPSSNGNADQDQQPQQQHQQQRQQSDDAELQRPAAASSEPAGGAPAAAAAAPSRAPVEEPSPTVEDDEHDAAPATGVAVATVILPGTEDTAEVVRRGGLELQWRQRTVKRFREKQMPHVVDESLALPTLYLHFLDAQFRPTDGCFDNALRAGNDNSELRIILPATYTEGSAYQLGFPMLPSELSDRLLLVMAFLKSQAEVQVSGVNIRAGGFSPKQNVNGSANPGIWHFGLQTARPKSQISLDKSAFGIPEQADLYLFAQNHISVAYMCGRENAAFQQCIAELPSSSDATLQKLAVFLKVFYEGGFAYNHKESMGKGYLPRNVGIAALGVVPAFEGQSGIWTGYPYLLEPRFLRFADTVPVTIPAISSMSSRHGRYGLCFTRCIFVWEGESYDREGVLDFCSIMPHGGFFYTPQTLGGHRRLGGLLYAFGEAKSDLEQPESVTPVTGEGPESTPSSRPAPAAAAQQGHDRRVCVACMDADATMAIVPCGHRSYCQSCSAQAQTATRVCPVCRTRVERTMRVF